MNADQQRLLDWQEYERRNRNARRLDDEIGECPLCSAMYDTEMMARHKGLCSFNCQKCGHMLTEDDPPGVHAGCISETRRVGSRIVRYVTFANPVAVSA